ncbi:MAG: hypothetical protein PHN55_05685 [Dysgonamonadaceae bacterium]|nr:hypothetical protein [Dysgonamonadaceae bacterium]
MNEGKFDSQWEKRRKKKWLYVFLHGSVYWGFLFAITLFLIDSRLVFEDMQLSKLLLYFLFFGVLGIRSGLSQFNMLDMIYLKFRDKMKEGIHEIQSGHTWAHENLRISQDTDETLIVQNELFWFDEATVTPAQINECFNLIMSDFNKLQHNSDFKEFAKNKSVKIQVFDNSESNEPLIEKTMKNGTSNN